MSLFIYVSGMLLDLSLKYTLNISSIVASVPAIETGWKVFRDLCTMFFIFILLYTAITTILGIGGGKENAKKVITSIVIAGLLINFSLFFTKIVIDASNLISLSFYKALVPEGAGIDKGLSAIFMQSLYIQTTYDPSKVSALSNDKLSGSALSSSASNNTSSFRILFNSVMGSIVMLIASIVFLAAAFFFMVRLVILLLLMVTSPIAFAGEALGGMVAERAKKWRQTLIDQCLFMPVYLAVTYVGVKIIASPQFQEAVNPANSSSFGGLLGGDSVAIVFNYCVVIIFLMASLIIAKEFGIMGADTFNGWAKNVGLALPRLAGAGAKNAGSYAGRNILGKKADEIDKWASGISNKSMLGKVIGNSRLGKSIRENTVGAIASNKFGGSTSFKDQEKTDKEIKEKEASIEQKKIIAGGISGGVVNPAAIAELKKLSGKQIENLKLDPDALKSIMPHLNKNQVEYLTEKSELSESQKQNLRTERLAGLTSAIGGAGDVDKELNKLSDSELERLDRATLLGPRFVEAVSQNPDKYKKLMESSIDDPTKIALKASVDAKRDTILRTGSPTDVKKLVRALPAKDLITLLEATPGASARIIANPGFIPALTISKLKEMTDLEGTIKRDIGTAITGTLPPHGAGMYVISDEGIANGWV